MLSPGGARPGLSPGVHGHVLPHLGLELFLILGVLLGGFDVEWILKVQQVREQRVQPPDHVLEAARWGPAQTIDRVQPQQRETDVTLDVDVRVPQLRQAFHLGGRHIILLRNVHAKLEPSSLPEALVRCDENREIAQHIGILEGNFTGRGQGLLQLLYFFHQQKFSDRDALGRVGQRSGARVLLLAGQRNHGVCVCVGCRWTGSDGTSLPDDPFGCVCVRVCVK